jgi:hypothetical protein
MTEKEAILLLITYNDWRRGDEIPMPEPKDLGIAIDTVIQLWKERNADEGKTIDHNVDANEVVKPKPILIARLRLNSKIDEEVLNLLKQDYHVIIEFEDIESSKYEILECSYAN